MTKPNQSLVQPVGCMRRGDLVVVKETREIKCDPGCFVTGNEIIMLNRTLKSLFPKGNLCPKFLGKKTGGKVRGFFLYIKKSKRAQNGVYRVIKA